MLTCIICHFTTELDDAVVGSPSGRCICLRCFDRETGSARPLPRALARELGTLLSPSSEQRAG